MLARTWLLLSLLGLALVGAAQAQQATIKRTVLQRSDVPGSTYEVVLGLAELRAAGLIGKHTPIPAPSRVAWSRANSPSWFRGSRTPSLSPASRG